MNFVLVRNTQTDQITSVFV